MAQPTLNLGGNLPLEEVLKQQQISRQQQMAQLLMQQGMQQPQGQMVSGRYVAPSIFQNLAGLANVYMGQRGIEKAEQEQLKMAERLREREGQSVKEYFEAGPDYQKALQIATNPYAPSWLKAQAVEQFKPQKLGEGEVLTRINPRTGQMETIASGGEKYRAPISVDTGARVELRDPRDPTKVLQVIPKSINPADAIRMQFEGMNVGGMPNMGGQPNISAQGGAAPQVKGVDEKFVPVVMPQYQYNPQLSPKQNQELSLKFNEKNLSNINNAKDSFDYLKQAAEILSTNKPSSGRLENIVTGTREFFGGGGEASKTDAQLNVLAGGLTMKQPRFEGPQGVLDVQLYQKLAGDVGNPNVPIASRLGAIEQMIGLQKKYYPNADWESIDIAGPVVKKNILGGTRGLGAQTMSPTEFKKTLPPADLEAFNWASKNPNDPRSAQIKKRLGIE
jgi:hypothetical protein